MATTGESLSNDEKRLAELGYTPFVQTLLGLYNVNFIFNLASIDNSGFNDSMYSWAVKYAPLVLVGVIGAVTIWWLASARHTFTGPIRTIDIDIGGGGPAAPAAGVAAASPTSG